MNNEKISVITVVRNDANNIERTILSVLEQTYNNIEYLVFDGNSTDGTWEIIQKYKDQLDIAVSEPDNGVYDAMNKGIQYASGGWVIFMNSGDTFYDHNVVQKIFSMEFDRNTSAIFGASSFYNRISGNSIVVAPSEDGLMKYMPSCHQSIFTATSELKERGFDTKYKIIADFIFYYFLYQRNPNYLKVDDIISIYDDSGISSNKKNTTKEYIKFFIEQRKFVAFRLLLRYIRHYLFVK